MPRLHQSSFVGSYAQPATGHDYGYEVVCRVAVDLRGRESMHIRGRIRRGNAWTGFVVLGHVDPAQSFIGREHAVALDCVAVTCARLATDQQSLSSYQSSRRPHELNRHRQFHAPQLTVPACDATARSSPEARVTALSPDASIIGAPWQTGGA